MLVAPYVAQRNAGNKKQKTKAMQVMWFQKERHCEPPEGGEANSQ